MQKITKDVSYVGVNDGTKKMFDAFFPLDKGTSYNSYLIKGSEKTVLIDTVDESKKVEYLKNLAKIKKIDYIVSNHAEQDHSGSIRAVLKKYPEAKVLTSAYCKSMLMDLHNINENKFELITENQEFSLGGKTLKFVFTPWAHWPETFSTYLIEDKILFSCDFFGAHLAFDKMFDGDKESVLKYSKIYFSLIMMPFREILKRNIEKVEELDIKMICPSHGPMHSDPKKIINLYKKWISAEKENKVLIPYVTMHGSTKILIKNLEEKLREKNIETFIFDLEEKNICDIAPHLVDSKVIIFGTPTILGEAHPAILNITNLSRMLKVKTEGIGVVGSYGWGGRAVEAVYESLGDINTNFLKSVMIKGLPDEKDFEIISSLSEEIEEIIIN